MAKIQAESVPSSRAPSDRDIQAQLQKVLASPSFSKSERLSAFLSFIVDETLRGAGDGLKEAVIARALYSKGEDFETAADPTVRIDARRLRDKLREYYSEHAGDAVVISVPKGRYAPQFEWAPHSVRPTAAPVSISDEELESLSATRVYRRPGTLIAVSLCLLGLVGGAIWLATGDPSPTLVSMPLTALPGIQGPPSLSPDGQLVAFEWVGPAQPRVQHIYLKDVQGETSRQLTDSPVPDRNPSWSPDGSKIAFIRGGEGAFVIPALGGGGERKIWPNATQVAWTADSKSLLIRDTEVSGSQGKPNGIYQVSLDTRERRRITQATEGVGDWRCSVSPDGKTLAFIRFGMPGIGDVYVVPMSGGEPRRITNWASAVSAVDWTPDGREVVFSTLEPQGQRLRRIAWNVRRPGKGTLVSGQTGEANYPSLSRPAPHRPVRLAYQINYLDLGLRLVDMAAVTDGTFMSVRPLADSTRWESGARFSADGSEVVFSSNRSGNREIWITGRDGDHLRQLTSMGAPLIMPFGWSPDGRTMLIDAIVDGNPDIYAAPTDGGRIRRLTEHPALDLAPAWSHDGKWIYFASTREDATKSTLVQIWRMPAGGGPATQITKNGGFSPQESFDGRYIYYLDHPQDTIGERATLMRIPVEGGEATEVLKGIRGVLWCVTRKGIFYVTRDAAGDALQIYQPDTGSQATVGKLNFRISGHASHMSVSEDGRWLITGEVNRNESVLMWIDNFR